MPLDRVERDMHVRKARALRRTARKLAKTQRRQERQRAREAERLPDEGTVKHREPQRVDTRPRAEGLTRPERQELEGRHQQRRRRRRVELAGIPLTPTGRASEISRNFVRQAEEVPETIGPSLVTLAGAFGRDAERSLRPLYRGKFAPPEEPRETPALGAAIVEDLVGLASPGPVVIRYERGGRPVYRAKHGGETLIESEAKSGLTDEWVERPLDIALMGRGAGLTGGRIVGKAGTLGLLGKSRRDLEMPGHVSLHARTGEPVRKPTSTNPLRRKEQESIRRITTGATGAIESRIGRELPVVGEHARAVRLLSRQERRREAVERHRGVTPFTRAFKPLSNREAVAVVMHAQGLRPSEFVPFVQGRRAIAKRNLEAAKASGDKSGMKRYRGERSDHKRMLKLMDKLGIDDALYDSVAADARLANARAAGEEITNLGGDLLESVEQLHPRSRLMRPYVPVRVMRGARAEDVAEQVGFKGGTIGTARQPGRPDDLGGAVKPGRKEAERVQRDVVQITAIEDEAARLRKAADADRGKTRPRQVSEARVRRDELEERLSDAFATFITRKLDLPVKEGEDFAPVKVIEKAFGDPREQLRRNYLNYLVREAHKGNRHKGTARAIRETGGKIQETAKTAQLHEIADEFFGLLNRHPALKERLDELEDLERRIGDYEKRRKPIDKRTAAQVEAAEFDELFGPPGTLAAAPKPDATPAPPAPEAVTRIEPMGAAWRELKPGDRITSTVGRTGTVERLQLPRKGRSQGAAWVRVRWDESGESTRVSQPGYELARERAEPAPLESGRVPELHPEQMDVDEVIARQQRAEKMPRPISAAEQADLLGEEPFVTPERKRALQGLSTLKDIQQRRQAAFDRRQRFPAQQLKPKMGDAERKFVGGPEVEGLVKEFEANPLLYVPHTGPKLREGQVPLKRSGIQPPRRLSQTRMNEGARLLASKWLPNPTVWRDQFLHALSYVHAKQRGLVAFKVGRPLNADGSKNQGWYYVRLTDTRENRPKRHERERADMDQQFEELLQGEGDIEGWINRNFVSRSEDDLRRWLDEDEGADVRQISADDYRELFGEFAPASRFLKYALDKPTNFWRQLTLTYRPAWVVNNIVGQTFLYAINHGSPMGVKAYAQAVLDEITAARKGEEAAPYFPEELRYSGFFESEAGGPGERSVTRALTGARSVERSMREKIQGFNSRASDNVPRRSAWYRLTDHARHLVNRIEKTNLTAGQFLDALEASTKPGGSAKLRRLHDDLVQQVLDELIDFQNLSHFERSKIRRLIPFYSWIKGITVASFRLGLDHPLRVELLALLAEAQGDRDDKQFGAGRRLLGNVVGLGEPVDRGRGKELDVLSTGGLNPLQTTSDVVRYGKGLVETNPERADNPFLVANPLAQLAVEAITAEDLFSGAPMRDVRGGRLGIVAQGALDAFPETQAARAILSPKPKVKATGDPRVTVPGTRYDLGLPFKVPSEALRFLGAPVKRINIDEAERTATEQARKRMDPEQRARYDARTARKDAGELTRKHKLRFTAEQRKAIEWWERRNVARARAAKKAGTELDGMQKLKVDLDLLVQYKVVSPAYRKQLVDAAQPLTTQQRASLISDLGGYFYRPYATQLSVMLRQKGEDWKLPSLN